jgi:hypothetical protein
MAQAAICREPRRKAFKPTIVRAFLMLLSSHHGVTGSSPLVALIGFLVAEFFALDIRLRPNSMIFGSISHKPHLIRHKSVA